MDGVGNAQSYSWCFLRIHLPGRNNPIPGENNPTGQVYHHTLSNANAWTYDEVSAVTISRHCHPALSFP
jgi:hypothetical protein